MHFTLIKIDLEKPVSDGNLSDEQKIIFTVCHALNCVDKLDWVGYKECFVKGEVIYDYTSLNGGEPYRGDVDAFINLVVQTLPGYQATSHQSANHEVSIEGESAVFKSSIIATHYLPNKVTSSDFWQAIGFYEINLQKFADVWKINQLKFIKTMVLGDCIGLRKLAKNLSDNKRHPRNFDSKIYTY